jgi:hypothetical protein
MVADARGETEPRQVVVTRIHRGELISVIGALILLPVMFLLKWYGVAVAPGPAANRSALSSAENAWNGLTDVRWLMLLTIIVTIGSVVLHASQRSHGRKTDTSVVVTAVAAPTAALLAYRVLVDLPSANQVVDQKIGAYVGLLAAIAIAFGGYESMRERRNPEHAVVHMRKS